MEAPTLINQSTALLQVIENIPDGVPIDPEKFPELVRFSSLFPPGFFLGREISKSELIKVVVGLSEAIHNNRTLPVVCRGPECPIRHICPIENMGIAPVDHECAVERASMIEWKLQYMATLNIDPTNKILMGMIDELVEIDIFNKYRFPAILSENMTAFEERVDTFSERTGALIQRRKEVSKAFEAKMAMAKRREELLKELIATPRQKAKYIKTRIKDPATEAMDITNKAEIAMDDLNNASE